MKPQAQILLIASFLYGVFHYARTRNARPLGMLVFPILVFLGYEAYFTISLFSALGSRGRRASSRGVTWTSRMSCRR